MANDEPTPDGGWDWLEAGVQPMAPDDLEAGRALALATARCFQGRDGETVLAYLRAVTIERALGPGAPDTLLRHLEGQRQLVVHLAGLVQRGRQGG